MNKTYQIIINNHPLTLTLTPPPEWGYCIGCEKDQPIRIISQHPNQLSRKFCRACSLNNLEELWEQSFTNQTQIMQEIRQFLLTETCEKTLEKTERLECYE